MPVSTLYTCPSSRTARHPLAVAALSAMLMLGLAHTAAANTYPVSPAQRATADQVAQRGVPLSELAPNAPDTYTVKTGDTLWAISQIFLKSPWRWPELWGMNHEQINNPHLIYPGQVLMLVKQDGMARLQLGQERSAGDTSDTVKLSPRIRSSDSDVAAIAAIPLNLIEPFLNDAVVFDADALATAPRVVASPEGRVLVTKGDLAYARGDFSAANEYRVFRNTVPLRDPGTQEILGYEARYLGTADLIRPGEERSDGDGHSEIVPATLRVKTVRQEIGVGDRLAPVLQRNFLRYVPHAPSQAVEGRIVSIYGDSLNAGQNQIVALNRGAQDGLERGHVLALWQKGRNAVDTTYERKQDIVLPDERHGVLFVFQVYSRVSYALIISVKEPVRAGDRFSRP
ncbi:LysM peptidoglycan-binding domain-containing protein [Roseateles koreensis]|uniref:LysM peptidoglycan-binding domain-containing protein n=1 Tax=Roseateles koreensis TaxID=2987526 RepID=A0ABT5KNU6_9BURK|nr:LysM peptidoglycan-binding domain-containing protein [Roseateles koreensis]MDC8784586.1 LysM peptidoglycan-binding domain-containing protein [Roseateles koreensis]